MPTKKLPRKISRFHIEMPLDTFTSLRKNAKFATSRCGRLFTKTQYKMGVDYLAWMFRERHKGEPVKDCNVSIGWSRDGDKGYLEVAITRSKEAKEKRMDVDAPVSAILDAMQTAGVIVNDRYIKRLEVEKQ